MLTSRRRTAALAALACLALSSCSGGGGGDEGRTAASVPAAVPAPASSPAHPPSSAPASPAASAPQVTSASVSPAASATPAGARWAGTKQFVQIKDAWMSGGRTYLAVRSARKQSATGPIEAWEIIPGHGTYATVPLARDGRILLSVPLGDDSFPYAYSATEFINRLKAESPSFREGLGFDLSFDANGAVVRLQSLYTP
ncbi:hypothetical protein ABZ883_11075 [Streptomyces sp. NPDC046977]|uniref:hypothetical protein n=1 Tax=Streptomyces sp. NPDC046977 TaxID=3154703 RepID=UPI0033C68A2E